MCDGGHGPHHLSPLSQDRSHACSVTQEKLSKDRELAGSRTREPQFHNGGGRGKAEIRHTGRQLWEEVGFNGMEGRGPSRQPGFQLPSPCWASQAASKVCYRCGHVTMFGPPWKRGVETGGTQFRRWLPNTPLVLCPQAQRGASAFCSYSCP